ncbi:peptidoglycan-associated lipoprotein Pal [bacterium]|nr:peptidoglycan-associated lipoprotein Pal [bacterium]
MALAFFNGCSSKKKVVEEPKKEVTKAPEEKPAPKPVVKEPERKPVEQPTRIQESAFQTVYFDFDKSDIRSDMKGVVTGNAEILNKNNSVKILIEGHCDERGTNEYNMALGQRRADSVKQFFMDYGISSSRLSTISYGEERPAAQGHNETAWSKNRRSEFRITSQ